MWPTKDFSRIRSIRSRPRWRGRAMGSGRSRRRKRSRGQAGCRPSDAIADGNSARPRSPSRAPGLSAETARRRNGRARRCGPNSAAPARPMLRSLRPIFPEQTRAPCAGCWRPCSAAAVDKIRSAGSGAKSRAIGVLGTPGCSAGRPSSGSFSTERSYACGSTRNRPRFPCSSPSAPGRTARKFYWRSRAWAGRVKPPGGRFSMISPIAA